MLGDLLISAGTTFIFSIGFFGILGVGLWAAKWFECEND